MQQSEPLAVQLVPSREFVFSGSVEAVGPSRDAIMEFVHEHCADEQQEIDILIALQEALANAARHGCNNDASKLIHCTAEVTPSEFKFIVQDPGAGFDSGGATDETEDGTNLTQHGRGIHLMRSLMDEVTYSKRGSQLQMKKLRRGAC